MKRHEFVPVRTYNLNNSCDFHIMVQKILHLGQYNLLLSG